MSKNSTAETEPRDVFTTVDYRYEVYTQSKDGRQLEGEWETRIALAKNRAMLMMGTDDEATTVCVHDRMARIGYPKVWKWDGSWRVIETRAA